jgi:hypothetical protein
MQDIGTISSASIFFFFFFSTPLPTLKRILACLCFLSGYIPAEPSGATMGYLFHLEHGMAPIFDIHNGTRRGGGVRFFLGLRALGAFGDCTESQRLWGFYFLTTIEAIYKSGYHSIDAITFFFFLILNLL